MDAAVIFSRKHTRVNNRIALYKFNEFFGFQTDTHLEVYILGYKLMFILVIDATLMFI